METAFTGPAKLRDRLGSLDPAGIAALDPDELVAVMKQTPSVHRFPGSMAGRLQSLSAAIVDHWGGDTAAIWTEGDPSGGDRLAGGRGRLRRGGLPLGRRHRRPGVAHQGARAQARDEGCGQGLSARASRDVGGGR